MLTSISIPGGPEALKLPSTGSIFLATGGTTSSSSQNSSLHKSPTIPGGGGILEASAMETVDENHPSVIDPTTGADEATLHEDDPNSVSPYASTSLIEQLRRGGGGGAGGGSLAFSEVIPPPPHYPPPPVPPDSPPPGSIQHTYAPSGCCHYAQSDLQQKMMVDEANGGPIFMGGPQTTYLPTAGAYAPPQEQYWPPNGMRYVHQQSVVNTTMSSQSESRHF